jgi:hypothetical protein
MNFHPALNFKDKQHEPMKKLAALFILSLGLLGFTACEEEQAGDEISVKERFLTTKTWKMTGFSVDKPLDWNDEGELITDIYGNDPCLQDNTMKYFTDKTYLSDEGANLCDDQQQFSGTWALDATETKIIENSGGITSELEILELTENSLKLRYRTDFWGGESEYIFEAAYVGL